jgi:hypothetical protein
MGGFWGRLRHHIQRLVKKPRARKRIADCIAFFLPKSELILNSDEQDIYKTLCNVGFSKLPDVLSQRQIDEVINFLKDKPVFERYDKKKRTFHVDSPPLDAHTGAYGNEDIVKCPHLLEAANNPTILNVAESLLGCKPTLSNIVIWHSFPNSGEAKNSENYHRDMDDFGFIKVFVYLSEVSQDSGPHVYIDGSHCDENFLELRRYTDSEIESFYGKDRVRVITGRRGDSFIENTFGIHKGIVCRDNGRIVLQFEYSILPIGAYAYNNKFEDGVVNVDKYVNRKYIL